jgi:predicted helicase
VDTLDKASQHFIQAGLFGVSSENTTRIRKQNEKKISVIIGNPPYNANQQNENDNNKNREYPDIDKRIKETFIKNSTAQKTKLYDMYSRFYRWAMDRLNDNGIIAFITNRSFIDSRTFDGFRKSVQQDFDHAYIIDTKSDVRANPKIAGTTHNVFGIQAGVAVLLLVKSSHKQLKPHPCKIEYVALNDFWRKEEKLAWFAENNIEQIEFENITPDKNSNWINMVENDWESLVPVCSKEVKNGRSKGSIFEIYSTGISTNRDEWIVDLDRKYVEEKMKYFSSYYNDVASHDDNTIKWSRNLKTRYLKGKKEVFNPSLVNKYNHRPFVPANFYNSELFIDEHGLTTVMFQKQNLVIVIQNASSSKPFHCLAVNTYFDLHFTGDSQGLPLYLNSKEGLQAFNITEWAVDLFRKQYSPEGIAKEINQPDIFNYVYAVLHDPAYRKKYELNLKREFPRVPLYDNFWQWAAWGKKLMELHIDYENVAPFVFVRKETAFKPTPQTKLKAFKDTGTIILDDNTELSGIPSIAWEYKLGNRSALEWILDQYKEKKPSDPTIAAKFNTYKFADYKEIVIDLLQRVCTVSVQTMKIIGEMEKMVV